MGSSKDTFSHPPIFFIEGNIGSGKSTLLTILKQHLSVDIIPAPSNYWDAPVGEDAILSSFYQDMQRWAYTLQSYAFISRMNAFEEARNKNINTMKIFERSVYCDRFCFARNCFENKTMSCLEWEVYKEWFSNLVERYMTLPHGFIYLRTDPNICLRRIKSRQQLDSKTIQLTYLTRLHEQHDDWLIKGIDVPAALADIPVLTLDGNHSFMENTPEDNNKEILGLLEQICSFMNNTIGKTFDLSLFQEFQK